MIRYNEKILAPTQVIQIAIKESGKSCYQISKESGLTKNSLKRWENGECLPQILLLENVSAIRSEENLPHFQKWLDYLHTIGYSNYVEDLNAVDFGVAQNRERTFVLSILGEYNYNFPVSIPLNKCIEDYFEELTEEEALQLVVKSEKAMELLEELDEQGKIN